MSRPPGSFLKDTHPHLRAEYSPDNEKPFDSLSRGMSYKPLWICPQGHEYRSVVYGRTSRAPAGCPVCSNKKIVPGVNDLATTFPEALKDWDYEKNSPLLPTQVSRASGRMVHWKCSKGHSWEASPQHRSKTTGCSQCKANMWASVQESEVARFLKAVLPNFEVRTSVRGVAGSSELDIYIPEKKIAVEYNGIYWHSDRYKDKNSHLRKYEACKSEGIQLIQVWEDDWKFRRRVVERMLRHKLGVSSLPRIPARKTSVEFSTLDTAKSFFSENHIQGFVGGSFYLALVYEGSPVAMMILKWSSDRELRLERYATSAVVPGGQSKLIRFAERKIPSWDSMITFADREVSYGDLYEATGWRQDKILYPDYKYLYKGQRVHKFRFRLKRFREDPELLWEEGLSERQLAELNDIPRVWDSGKVRYRYYNPMYDTIGI